MDETPSRLVERMLAERIGLDPSSVGEALIARGVHARMAALGLRSKDDYDRSLIEQRDEVQALVEEVVVPESWFFRDEKPFDLLADFARSGWANDPDRAPLEALSIPCAGGEEPYSIAVTLLDAGLPKGRFRVDAVDVSARSVARAIAGVYGRNAFRGKATPALPSYFRDRDGAFVVEPSVRACVRFHLGNLLDPALFLDRPPFDVVFCRNLLIYLDDEAKALAYATLGRLLAEGGLLFLGHADRLEAFEQTSFRPTANKGAFAFVKGEARAKSPGARPAQKPLATVSLPRKAATALPIPDKRPVQPIPPGGPGIRNEPRAANLTELASVLLERGSSLADLGRYDEATAVVESVIRRGEGGAPAYFLLSLIAQAAGRLDRAESHLLKAVYLDSQHDQALLALAMLARRKGDIVGEAAYRKRADRVLARKAVP